MVMNANGMRRAISCIVLLALFGTASCGKDRSEAKAARAAAELFTLDDASFTQFLHTMGRDHEQGDARAQLREEWQRNTLFARAAMAGALDQDPEYRAALLRFQRDTLAQRYVDRALRERATNVVLKPQYAAKKDEFAVPEVHLAAIFLAEKPEGGDLAVDAQGLLQQLATSADFAAVAKEHSSDGATAARGGDMGWLPIDVAVQRFGEAVSNAEPGAVLGPIAVPHGAYLVKVVEAKRTRVPDFADVRRQLLEQQRTTLIVELEKELKAKSNIAP